MYPAAISSSAVIQLGISSWYQASHSKSPGSMLMASLSWRPSPLRMLWQVWTHLAERGSDHDCRRIGYLRLGLQNTWWMVTPASLMASPTILAWVCPITVRGQSLLNPSGPPDRCGTLLGMFRSFLW